MASADSPLPSSSAPLKKSLDLSAWGVALAAFLLLLSLFAALTSWILQHHYLGADALNRWAKVLGFLDSGDVRVENLGLVYPHLPIYLLIPFYWLPGLRGAMAPYLLSNILAASLLAWWFVELRRQSCSRLVSVICVLLVGLHPFFLWAATSGTKEMLTLVCFYIFCRAIRRLEGAQELQAVLLVGATLAICFFVDEKTLYLMVALVPLLPFVLPRYLIERGTITFYLVTFTPVIFAVLSWAYMNWIFQGDPWEFLRDPHSGFRGAWAQAPFTAWLRECGGRLLYPLATLALLAAAAFPGAGWWFASARASGALRAGGVLFLLPVIAGALATQNYHLAHPMEMLFLLSAVALSELPPRIAKARWRQVALLALGMVAGWRAATWSAPPELEQWRNAVFGRPQAELFAGERALGQWLAANRRSSMLDDHFGYAAIVSRGDARGLLLPFSAEFKIGLQTNRPGVDQVVVPNPAVGENARDLINERFPRLYLEGLDGYALVYDHMNWRVYQRTTPSATVAQLSR